MTRLFLKKKSCMVFLVCFQFGSSWASELVSSDAHNYVLHLNGVSYHFNKNKQNRYNYGLGFSYNIGRLNSRHGFLDDSRLAFEFDGYRDSYGNPAYAGGFYLSKNLSDRFDWGLKAGLVHSHDLQDSGNFLYPYVLPFVESVFKSPVNIRITLVPPWGSVTDGELTFQLMIDFSKYRP